MKPLFSIIIPLYNKEKEIRQTLESVLLQSFHDFEVIVINDGSTDGSETIVKSFSDNRIKLITTANQGVSKARNLGLEKTTGQLIAFLDADDYWYPNHLEDLFQLYQQFPKAGLLATNYELYFGENSIIQPTFDAIPTSNWNGIVPDFFKSSMRYRLAWTSAVAVPKKVLAQIGNFDESITLGAGEDTDMWIRIAITFPVAFTTSKSARYKMTAQNKISFSETTKRQFAKLNKFKDEEKTNYSLKRFLDLYRVVYALKHKLAGDSQNFEFYYAAIDLKNCSLKSKILLKSPRFVLQKLMKLSKTFNSNTIYFDWYTRLFKS
ncbi:glycosyltransferase family 2 protein [Flavobacterium sp.]|uniref:glycosyltransferase family 2 protein n=1 Tax=Flavobacterium sp. TaxID=239 RepID=UPI00260F9C28|nr:glycosyltransferase family 2 protein [Flavobacterium sp.]MDD2987192.1 glycosyltransferase family 2 protein [Flavobacterium sp.]